MFSITEVPYEAMHVWVPDAPTVESGDYPAFPDLELFDGVNQIPNVPRGMFENSGSYGISFSDGSYNVNPQAPDYSSAQPAQGVTLSYMEDIVNSKAQWLSLETGGTPAYALRLADYQRVVSKYVPYILRERQNLGLDNMDSEFPNSNYGGVQYNSWFSTLPHQFRTIGATKSSNTVLSYEDLRHTETNRGTGEVYEYGYTDAEIQAKLDSGEWRTINKSLGSPIGYITNEYLDTGFISPEARQSIVDNGYMWPNLSDVSWQTPPTADQLLTSNNDE